MLLSPEGDPDALDIPTPRTYREVVSREWASKWKAAMNSELASWRSTGTYVDAVPPPRANVVDGMWLFKVKRPPISPPMFKARYVARGLSQPQRYYELHSLSTAFLQGRLYKEIWLRCPPGFTETFPPGTQWSLRRPVYGLCQSPREWHASLCSTLRDLEFRPSSADPSLFVRAGSTPFFILVYIDDLVFAIVDRAVLGEVKSELQKRQTCAELGELQRYLCHKSGHMWRDCYKLPDGWNLAQGKEGRGAGGGRGRGRGGRGGRGGGAATNGESFEEPAAVGKVTLHSLDYWVIDSGATYSMTPRADLLTELEPSPVKHVTSALGQRAEVKGM
ncbi:unnamed protein product [Closterium sp. NIES-53]